MPDNFTIYTPTALAGSYFGLALDIEGAGQTTGAGDVTVNWTRRVTPVRLPNDTVNTVKLIVGRLDGQAVVRNYYVVGTVPPLAKLASDGTNDSLVSTTVTISAGTDTVSYTGLLNGAGFVFEQVAERAWTLKSGTTVKLLA